jgi:hypothetical protein
VLVPLQQGMPAACGGGVQPNLTLQTS